MNIAFPLFVTSAGQTAICDRVAYLRQLVELTLFTAPGERVDRPEFGCGVMELVFSEAGSNTATATAAIVKGALHEALRHVIEVKSVAGRFEQSTLSIEIKLVDRQTNTLHTIDLERQL